MTHSGSRTSQIWNTLVLSLFSNIPSRCCLGMWTLLLRMRQIPERAWCSSETLPLIRLYVLSSSTRPWLLCLDQTPWELLWVIPWDELIDVIFWRQQKKVSYNFISTNWLHCESNIAALTWKWGVKSVSSGLDAWSLPPTERVPEITMEVSKCSSQSCERARATWLLGGINYIRNILRCKAPCEHREEGWKTCVIRYF